MLKDIKKQLQFFIVLAVSMFLLPTILLALGVDLSNLHDISALFMIAGVISSIISAAIGLIIIYKSKSAMLVIQKAELTDDLWDEDQLKYQVRFVFYKMLNAWNNGDASIIKDFVTPEYFQSFTEKLQSKIDVNVDDITNSIDIADTRIICCQDLLDNNEDKFVGYIKWKFRNESTREVGVIWNNTNKESVFEETYHFKRFSDDWLLYQTDDKISLWKILLEKNYYQNTN